MAYLRSEGTNIADRSGCQLPLSVNSICDRVHNSFIVLTVEVGRLTAVRRRIES